MNLHCPNCGTSIEPLTRAMREAAERDFARRLRQAEHRRHRYSTDPAYRARQLARVRARRARNKAVS